jgi:hypothetical protein
MKVKEQFLRGRPKSRWRKQARKHVTQKEGTLEETEDGLVERCIKIDCQMTHMKCKHLRKKKKSDKSNS